MQKKQSKVKNRADVFGLVDNYKSKKESEVNRDISKPAEVFATVYSENACLIFDFPIYFESVYLRV